MHVVFVTNEFIADKFYCGGLANFTANMARVFRDKGNEVTIIVLAASGKSFLWENGIQIEYIDMTKELFLEGIFDKSNAKAVDFYRYLRVFYGSYLVKKKLQEINIKKVVDIVHYCNLQAVSLFKNKDIPYVVRLSSYNNLWKGAYQQVFLPGFKQNKSDKYDRLEEFAVKRAYAVISPSRLLAGITLKQLGRRAKVIESPYLLRKEDWDYRIYSEDLSGKRYILFFGSLGYLKGAHIIGEVIHAAMERYQDLYFVLIGRESKLIQDNKEVGAHSYIRKRAGEYHDRLIYFQQLPKEQLYPIIQNSYCCLLPSRIDNLPNACIEAMAVGKAVIGTRGASFEQLIKDRVSGFLCERDCPETYLAAIHEVMALSRQEIETMGEKAMERIKDLEPGKIYKEYLDFYVKVIRSFQNKRKKS